jgi:hypothetical protein
LNRAIKAHVMNGMALVQRADVSDSERLEIETIIKNFGTDGGNASLHNFIDSQLSVLHARAQSLLQMAGVVITVTGFSGRIIADTNPTAQALIIGGVALVAVAAIIALIFVMPIKWLSSYMHLSQEEFLLTAIRRRTKKDTAFRTASVVLICGMALYVASIALMLFYPEATELTKVR